MNQSQGFRPGKQVQNYRLAGGLFALCVGLVAVLAAAVIVTGQPWLSGVIIAGLLPSLMAGQQRLAAGAGQNAAARPDSTTLVGFGLALVSGLSLLGLLFLLMGREPGAAADWLAAHIGLLLGLLGAGLWFFVGALFKVPRYFAYALLTVVALGLGDLSGENPFIVLVGLGFAVALIGAARLAGSLRQAGQGQLESTRG